MQQRAALNQKLIANRARDSDLNIAILAAWENVGDQDAVAYVDRLAHAWAWPGAQMQVRKAARKCLVPLEKRLEEEHAARLSPVKRPVSRKSRTPESRRERELSTKRLANNWKNWKKRSASTVTPA